MKTTIYQFGILALILLAGCTNDDAISTSNVTGNHSLVATIEGQDMDSRSAVDDNGNVTWIESDVIGVFGTQTQNAKFSATGSGVSVTFKGDLSSAKERIEWAYYPYDVEASASGTSLTFTLPSEYTYTGNSNAPMVGVKNKESENFTFKHLCGLLRITLGGGMPNDADRFVITSAGDGAQAIAGVATVNDIIADETILTVSENGGSKCITYKLGDLIGDDSGFKTFFVPLPVGSYDKLEVALYGKDKTEPYFTRTVSGLNVGRSVMKSMPILNGNTGEEYVLSKGTVDLSEMSEDVSVSSTDNSILIYSRDVLAMDIPKKGSVLWSRVTDKWPDGFLGKVVNVEEKEDGTYEVTTEAASLTEAFDKLYVSEEVELMAENMTLGTRAIGTGEFNIMKDFSFEIKDKGKPYKALGDISVGANFVATIEINKNLNLEYMAFSLTPKFEINGGFQIEGEFNSEGDWGDFTLNDINLGRILLSGGLIQIVPAAQCHLYIVPKGRISLGTMITFAGEGKAAAVYKNGIWEKGFNPAKKEKNESPLSLNSKICMSGELFYGTGLEFKGKLYNNDNLKIYIIPKIGYQLEGKLEIDSNTFWEELEVPSLDYCYCLKGSFGLDPTWFKGLEKAEFEFPEITWGERSLFLLPSFNELSAAVVQQSQSGEVAVPVYEAVINTKANGELLTKDTQISFVIEDEAGNEIKETNPVDYGGGQLEEGTYTTIPVAVSGKFDNLKMDATYSIYPVIYSSVIKNYADDGKLRLKNQAVEIKTDRSFEDKLMQIYRNTNGDNWLHKDGWNVDGKVILRRYADGTGTSGYLGGCANCVPGITVHNFDLSGNNLKGNVILKDCPEIQILDISNNVIPNLVIENCENLTALKCNNTQMENLTVIDCPSLGLLECNGNELGGNIQIVNSFILGSRQNSSNNFPRFECSNNSREILDLNQCSQWGEYVNIILEECPNLHSLRIEMNTPFNLDCSSCPQIKNLNLEMPGLAGLTLSKCLNLTELTLKGTNQLSDFRCIDNPNLSTLSISGSASYINRFDCSGCDKLSILNCNHCFWRPGTGLNHITELTLIECYDFHSFNPYDFQKTLKKLVINSSNYNYVHCNLSGYSALIYADLGKFGNFASLENCTSLQTLCFNGSMLRDNIGELKKDCLEELKKCTALKELYLYGGYGEIPVEFTTYNLDTDSHKYEYIYDSSHSADNPGEYLVNWRYTEHSGWWYPGEPEKGYSGW